MNRLDRLIEKSRMKRQEREIKPELQYEDECKKYLKNNLHKIVDDLSDKSYTLLLPPIFRTERYFNFLNPKYYFDEKYFRLYSPKESRRCEILSKVIKGKYPDLIITCYYYTNQIDERYKCSVNYVRKES